MHLLLSTTQKSLVIRNNTFTSKDVVFIYYTILRQKIFKKHFEIISTSRKQQILFFFLNWEIISHVEKTQELLMLNTK